VTFQTLQVKEDRTLLFVTLVLFVDTQLGTRVLLPVLRIDASRPVSCRRLVPWRMLTADWKRVHRGCRWFLAVDWKRVHRGNRSFLVADGRPFLVADRRSFLVHAGFRVDAGSVVVCTVFVRGLFTALCYSGQDLFDVRGGGWKGRQVETVRVGEY
jgi:hypothetical protein